MGRASRTTRELRWAACGLLGCLAACDSRAAVDTTLAREAEPLRHGLERHGEWVARTLRSHADEEARAEVLFSPLRLESEVLDAVVIAGPDEHRYVLHDGEGLPEGSWTVLPGAGGGELAAQRDTCELRRGDGQDDDRVPCIWLRLDAREDDPVLGFRLWVAYRH